MTRPGKYDVSGLVEAQAEPGSRGRVLRNLLGITRKREMDEVEAHAQLEAMEALLDQYDAGHRFTANDVCQMHKVWLGRIYEWAGEYRRVNLSKGGFPFASAAQIPRLMEVLERDVLTILTPCRGMSAGRLAAALAEVHVELVLIHPFRDGNGRAARMLATLMAAQAGLPPLELSRIRGKQREQYFAAVRAGLDRDYGPMTGFFEAVIRQTCRHASAAAPPGASPRPCEDPAASRARPRSRSTTPRKRTAGGSADADR